MGKEKESTPQVEVQNAENVTTEADPKRAEREAKDETSSEHEPTDTAADEEPMDTGRLHE